MTTTTLQKPDPFALVRLDIVQPGVCKHCEEPVLWAPTAYSAAHGRRVAFEHCHIAQRWLYVQGEDGRMVRRGVLSRGWRRHFCRKAVA